MRKNYWSISRKCIPNLIQSRVPAVFLWCICGSPLSFFVIHDLHGGGTGNFVQNIAENVTDIKTDCLANQIEHTCHLTVSRITWLQRCFEIFRLNGTIGFRRPCFNNGTTPKEYVISLKMEQAKELLMSEKLLIRDIALMLGYSDIYHFGKIFTKKTGFTPSEYRSHFLWQDCYIRRISSAVIYKYSPTFLNIILEKRWTVFYPIISCLYQILVSFNSRVPDKPFNLQLPRPEWVHQSLP